MVKPCWGQRLNRRALERSRVHDQHASHMKVASIRLSTSCLELRYRTLAGVVDISTLFSFREWSKRVKGNILVDELPQLAKVEHRERFHALVQSVAERTRSPVVFVLSSHSTRNNGSMEDATTSNIYFPNSLLSHSQVTEQKLLQVNKTSLRRRSARSISQSHLDPTIVGRA